MLADEKQAKSIIDDRLTCASDMRSLRSQVEQCIYVFPSMTDYILAKAKELSPGFEPKPIVIREKAEKPKRVAISQEQKAEQLLYDRFCILANQRGLPKLSILQIKRAEAKGKLPDRLREHMFYVLWVALHGEPKVSKVQARVRQGYTNEDVNELLRQFGY